VPRLAASMHAAKSWQASYPASAIRLCRPYSLAREVSNFSEFRGDDFKAVLHVLKSSYARHSNNKNSLILCGAFLKGMHGSKSCCLLELIQPLVDSQLWVVLCRSCPRNVLVKSVANPRLRTDRLHQPEPGRFLPCTEP
jgi:hypothetical protein